MAKRPANRSKNSDADDELDDDFGSLDSNLNSDGVVFLRKNDFSAFEPKGKDLVKTYPELAEKQCFLNLSMSDVMFAWLVACPSSPMVVTIKDRKNRVLKALDAAYAKYPSFIKRHRDEYLDGDFSEPMQEALSFFQNVNIGVRLRAAFIVEDAISKTEMMIMGVTPEKLAMMDADSSKAYMSNLRESINSLPNLIKMAETNFSISVKKKERKSNSLEEPTMADMED